MSDFQDHCQEAKFSIYQSSNQSIIMSCSHFIWIFDSKSKMFSKIYDLKDKHREVIGVTYVDSYDIVLLRGNIMMTQLLIGSYEERAIHELDETIIPNIYLNVLLSYVIRFESEIPLAYGTITDLTKRTSACILSTTKFQLVKVRNGKVKLSRKVDQCIHNMQLFYGSYGTEMIVCSGDSGELMIVSGLSFEVGNLAVFY